MGMYFDGIDVGEACAHEFAAAALGVANEQGLRAMVGDPRDLMRRPANVALTTLTLRADPTTGEATFLLHWRDPAKVGHAGGLYQLLPVGVFQPSGDAEWNQRSDFRSVALYGPRVRRGTSRRIRGPRRRRSADRL